MVMDFSLRKYQRLIEFSSDLALQRCMEYERGIITTIDNPETKTLIHPKAGYGMLTCFLSNLFGRVVSIENNKGMLEELKARSTRIENASVVEGNITELLAVCKGIKLEKAVFLLDLNALGFVENPLKLLQQIKSFANNVPSQLVLTLYRQDAMKTWGLKLYGDMRVITGDLDFDRTDYYEGIFTFKTCLKVKWWKDYEVKSVLDSINGTVVKSEVTKNFLTYLINL